MKFKTRNAFLIFIYLLFIISNLYLGGLKIIGDFSIRVPVSIISLFIVLFSLKLSKKKYDNYLFFPVIFLLAYLLSTAINNIEDIGSFFTNTFLSGFFIAYIMIWFSFKMVPKFISINKLLIFLGVILTINSVVILGQFFYVDFFWKLSDYFLSHKINIIDSLQYYQRHGTIYGLMGAVQSGYYLVAAVPIFLYILITTKVNRLVSLMFLLINIAAAIVLQQRTAFILVFFTIMFFFLVRLKNFKMTFLFVLLCVAFYFLFEMFEQYLYTIFGINPRISSLEMNPREHIYNYALTFISNNPLWGNIKKFVYNNHGVNPHNLFLNAWLRGGLLGFISIISLVIILVKRILIVLFDVSFKKKPLWFIAIILLNEIVMSFTHNAGLTSGEQLTYLILGLFIIELNRQRSFVVKRNSYGYQKTFLNIHSS